MVKLKLVVGLLIILVLVSCLSNIPASQPTATKSSDALTPTISIKTSTPTKKPTFTATSVPTSTPLIVISPYQTKQVVLEYTRFGGALGSPDFIFDGFFGGGRETTRFVLYEDGQFILQEPLKPILAKTLTENEKEQLLSPLNKNGFYSIETNLQANPTNPIYDFGGKYDEVKITDGVTSCLSANVTTSKEICFYEPYRDFLVPQMKDVFQFVYDYSPSNMTVYQPDRLLVFVSKGRGFYDSFAVEPAESVPWSSEMPSLETPQEEYMYIEGENAMKVFSLFQTRSWLKIFSEGGQDYSVFIDVVFPHENLIQP